MKRKIGVVMLIMLSLFLVSCKKNDEKDKTYNVVIANATIPPLMSLIDVLDNGHDTLMWYGRTNTIYSLEGLKKQIQFVGDPQNQEEVTGISPTIVSEMKNRILDIYYKSKETAKFNLYVVDYGVKVALQLFVETGIKEENYQVHLLEDGSGSYNQFIKKDEFATENGKEKFDAAVKKLDSIIEEVKEGNYKWQTTGNISNWELSYAYATKSNVSYWLQYPEVLYSNDPKMQEVLDKKEINLVKKRLTSMYEGLNSDKQELFKNAILDIKTFDSMINYDNGKDTLIVTGTSYTGEEIGFVEGPKSDNELEFVMDHIIKEYGETHNILFKPHPSWMPSLGDDMGVRWEEVLGKDRPNEWLDILKSRVKYFEDNNILVLPGQTPIEAILWAYPNVKIGGYNSSLYMNASQNQVEFFILKDNDYNKLSFPLPYIIKNGGMINTTTNKNPSIIYPGLFDK